MQGGPHVQQKMQTLNELSGISLLLCLGFFWSFACIFWFLIVCVGVSCSFCLSFAYLFFAGRHRGPEGGWIGRCGVGLGGGGRGENMIIISCMENIFQLKKSEGDPRMRTDMLTNEN